ncbi:MAG: peptide ABC transporter substrate-binding protein [FCB group bacterium]|jgi:oligopeptide transport system substrate-binding protein|nr:peptide ABC transporter substrate-binding protein [FCB group bacterium]
MKSGICAGLCAVLLLGAFGCGSKDTRVEQNTRAGILDYNNGVEPQDLDPQITVGFNEHKVLSALFEGLTDLEPKTLQPIPATAESWTVSDDGKVYTFKIRTNAKWSDGAPLTAEDFVYSWQRILSPGLASEYAYMLFCIENGEAFNKGTLKDASQIGVKALDARTLEVRLVNPTPYFLSMQVHNSFFPVRKAAVEKHGRMDERGTRWTRPGNLVGNGPFRLEDWRPNQYVKTVRNEHYWDAGKVRLNGITFYPIESSLTEERSFRAGDLHLTSTVPIQKIAVYRKENPKLMRIDPFFGSYFYRLNVTRKPLDDVRVRRALSLAIDRESIVRDVTKGDERPAYFFTPPDTAGYTCRTMVAENVEEAKRLLAEAGYPDGKGFPSIEIKFNTLESHKSIAEAIQQMWRKHLGIEATLVNEDWKVYLSSMTNLDYDVTRSTWIGDYFDAMNYLECFVTGGGNNRTGWSNAKYDELIKQAAATLDSAQRLELYQRAEAILLDELPIVPIYFMTRPYLISPDVKGWEPSILGQVIYKEVYLEPAQ